MKLIFCVSTFQPPQLVPEPLYNLPIGGLVDRCRTLRASIRDAKYVKSTGTAGSRLPLDQFGLSWATEKKHKGAICSDRPSGNRCRAECSAWHGAQACHSLTHPTTLV